jgi:hypothetical protein
MDIELTGDQVDAIRDILKHANNLETDERQLLNGLLEMAEHHPGVDRSWSYHQPQLQQS